MAQLRILFPHKRSKALETKMVRENTLLDLLPDEYDGKKADP
jgi:hypothetical protein